MERPLRAATRARRSVARRRATPCGVPTPRDPIGFGAEGTRADRGLGAAKVARGTFETAVGPQPGALRRGRRARDRDRRRVASTGASETDQPDHSRGIGPGTLNRMRRFLFCFVAVALLALVALVASACSSTLNDAATITYSQSGNDHDAHVTRADLVDEVRQLAADKPFAAW